MWAWCTQRPTVRRTKPSARIHEAVSNIVSFITFLSILNFIPIFSSRKWLEFAVKNRYMLKINFILRVLLQAMLTIRFCLNVSDEQRFCSPHTVSSCPPSPFLSLPLFHTNSLTHTHRKQLKNHMCWRLQIQFCNTFLWCHPHTNSIHKDVEHPINLLF